MKKYLNQETFRYILFGVFTTILNILLFYLLVSLGMAYPISNLITLVVVKLVSYLCNKLFVFHSKCNHFLEFVKEFFLFFFFRGITFLMDYFGLILFVEVFHFDKIFSKIVITVVVVVANYVFGKKYVFLNHSSD